MSEHLGPTNGKIYKAVLKKVDFIGFAIFSISSHSGYSAWLNFNILKLCSQVNLHTKFDNHRYRVFSE